MIGVRITRRTPRGGAVETPHRYRGGYYKLADPALGSDKKLNRFEKRVWTIAEVAAHVTERGFHVRMSAGPSSPPSLISPAKLEVYVGGLRTWP